MTAVRTTIVAVAPETSRAAWPAYAALVAGGALLLKAGLIIGNEGEMNESVTTGLYLGGLLVALAAAVGTGLQARRGRRTVTAVGLVLLIVVYVMALSDAVGPLFEAIKDEAYVSDEGPVGLLGLALLALGLRR